MRFQAGFILFEAIVAIILLSSLGLLLLEQQSVAVLETDVAIRNEQQILQLADQLNDGARGLVSLPLDVPSRWFHWSFDQKKGHCLSLWGAS